VAALSHGAVSRSAEVAAPGLTVMAVILFMGKISGAHLKPWWSVWAFAIASRFPMAPRPRIRCDPTPGWPLSRACSFWRSFGNVGGLVPPSRSGINGWQALLIRGPLTLGLVSTILGSASGAQNVGPLSALVGAYIVLAGLWASPISAASTNPARSFGRNLLALDFANFWIYLLGPTLGRCWLWALPMSCVVPADGIPTAAAAAEGALSAR